MSPGVILCVGLITEPDVFIVKIVKSRLDKIML